MNYDILTNYWHYFYLVLINLYALVINIWKHGEEVELSQFNLHTNFALSIITVCAIAYGDFFQAWGVIQYGFGLFYFFVLIGYLFGKPDKSHLPESMSKYDPWNCVKAQIVYVVLLWVGGFFG